MNLQISTPLYGPSLVLIVASGAASAWLFVRS